MERKRKKQRQRRNSSNDSMAMVERNYYGGIIVITLTSILRSSVSKNVFCSRRLRHRNFLYGLLFISFFYAAPPQHGVHFQLIAISNISTLHLSSLSLPDFLFLQQASDVFFI